MVPFEIQIPLLLKALTYDRTLKARVDDQVRIAIIVPKGGQDTAADLLASINALPERTVNGMPVVFKELVVTDQPSLDQALRAGRWAAAYVLPGFKPEELAMV